MNIKYNATRLLLLALGLVAWASAGHSLQKRGSFEFVPNAFSLKGSPFGRTLAMAMQGPVDVYFHQGQGHDHGPGADDQHEGCGGCSGCGDSSHSDAADAPEPRAAAEDSPSGDQLLVTTGETGGHVHDDSCSAGCGHDVVEPKPETGSDPSGLRAAMLEKIRDWRGAKNTRTNPLSNSESHKRFIRMEVEKKLFLTYEMDPTNYASYGSYYLFLSETSLGTRVGSEVQARRLAEYTVSQCLKESDNPVAMLTAAAASHDMVQILVGEESSEAQQLATKYAKVTSQSLDQFDQVSLQMLFDGTWERFSPVRQAEMTERARLLRKLHEADLRTLESHVSVPSEPEGSPAG